MKTIFSWKMENYFCDRSFPSGEGKMGFWGEGQLDFRIPSPSLFLFRRPAGLVTRSLTAKRWKENTFQIQFNGRIWVRD